ncbi:MAG: nucleotidyltransferase domain-containing protein [Candidatus Aminicenantes bacterium]|nr:nucleotidyltransferase domain-containing protein [Candidatus Aminicenantes bacterium]MDH5468914.1 nucleotidyltransferase domain-containing protein [Candidatus Aminicenantes bacterium]MDH5705904.1 nucleotidyltransferase domain-containing protein [Candidatus Aminicenantes bacterium]
MRFHDLAEELLSSRAKITILKVLLRFPGKKYSGREIARLSGVSPSRASEILDLFWKNGLAHRLKIGNTYEWSLNQESVLSKKVSDFIDLDEKIYQDLKSRIYKALDKEKNVIRVILYGSVTKGTEKHNSDIDLFILVKNEKDKEAIVEAINTLNFNLIPFYGNVISALIYSQREWKLKKERKILMHIDTEGEVILDKEKSNYDQGEKN